MEEILASIRRIIEDSDQARQPEPGQGDSEPLPQAERLEVQTFSDELKDDAGEPAATFAPAEPKDEMLAGADPEEMAGAMPDAEQGLGETTAEASVVDEREAEDLSFAEAVGRGEDVAPAMEPGQEMSVPVAPTGASGIISDRAGRQVAAAFEELSEAFAASRRRSFDEMAEEMLRPMLQDWLDNNLPTLVERLVREEIERIARGAAR